MRLRPLEEAVEVRDDRRDLRTCVHYRSEKTSIATEEVKVSFLGRTKEGEMKVPCKAYTRIDLVATPGRDNQTSIDIEEVQFKVSFMAGRRVLRQARLLQREEDGGAMNGC